MSVYYHVDMMLIGAHGYRHIAIISLVFRLPLRLFRRR